MLASMKILIPETMEHACNFRLGDRDKQAPVAHWTGSLVYLGSCRPAAVPFSIINKQITPESDSQD